jgi:hypothetical protein
VPEKVPKWAQYNAKEFSPYALANGNARSVAVVKVKGSPFARKEISVGNSNRPAHALVPVFFIGAHGCAGEDFSKEHEHAPLQLSRRDFEKWDFSEGDYVVIIGGQSRTSRLIEVDSWEAQQAGMTLTDEGGGRESALEFLTECEYDTGSAGKDSDEVQSSPESSIAPRAGTPRPDQTTTAGRLQARAEKEGIETLTHSERGKVACRLLKWGWDPAWDWFKTQFGAEFKPDITKEQFTSILRTYPEDYTHVSEAPQS